MRNCPFWIRWWHRRMRASDRRVPEGRPVLTPSNAGPTLADWARRMDPEGRAAAIVALLEGTNEILKDFENFGRGEAAPLLSLGKHR